MDVGTVQSPAVNITTPGQKAGTPQAATPQAAPEVKVYTPVETTQSQDTKTKTVTASDSDTTDTEKTNKEKKAVETTVVSLNQLMDLMTADIRFQIHQKTNRLMVQLVSEKDQRVLREYPSKEFLDMIANLRDIVGVLTDKKA